MATQSNVLASGLKLFKIAEHLKRHGGRTVTELSSELSMPKSTVQVYLNTLHDHRLVVKEEGEYSLGLRFLEYGMSALWDEPAFPQMKSKVEELAASTGELAAFFVEQHGKAIYVYGTEGERAIRTDLSVGEWSPLHATASGKAIMAHLPEERVHEIIEEEGLVHLTENTITDPDVLIDELAQIRDQGYAVSEEESVEGMRAVAAPVLLDDGVAGSISLAGPADRFVRERFRQEIPDTVKAVANEIQLNLTYSQSGL